MLSWLVSSRLKSKFEHYSKLHLQNGMSGWIAEKMLQIASGMYVLFRPG
jgi:Zn-dependent membrane protease YugP